MATSENAVAGAAEHPFGIAGDDVRSLVEVFGLVDDAIAQQKAVDGFEWNARNRLGHRTGANAWRELDGAARLAAIEGQAWLAVDVTERQRVAGVDQVGVLDLRIGPPQLWPLPGLAQVFAGNIPESVP